MAPINDIINALGQGNRAIEQTNPYTGLAGMFGQLGQAAVPMVAQNTGRDRTEALLGAGLAGLLGGATNQMGVNYTTNQGNLYQEALLGALQGKPVTEDSGLNSALVADVNRQAKLLEMQRLLRQQEQKDSLVQLLQTEAIKTSLQDPMTANTVLSRLMGIDPNPAKPIVADEEPTQEKALADEYLNIQKKLVDAGTPRTQAAAEARELMSARKDELKRSYKEVDEAVAKLNGIRGMYENLSQAVAGAGDTGVGGNIRQFGAKILGEFGVADQAKKAASGEDLQSMGSEIVLQAKDAGRTSMGPLTDKDVQMLLASGPSLTNTEQGNKKILERYQIAIGLQDKYLNHLYDAQNKGIPLAKAKQEWNNLRKDNPYFLKDENGEFKANPFWTGEEITLPNTDEAGNLKTEATMQLVGAPEFRTLKTGERVKVQKTNTGQYIRVE